MPLREPNANELHSCTTQATTLIGQTSCCTQPNDDKTTDRRTEHYTTRSESTYVSLLVTRHNQELPTRSGGNQAIATADNLTQCF